jgi:nucleoside 2-deoxyribosyltransferase
MQGKVRLYLAAGLFTPVERERNAEIARRFSELGYAVFLPQDIRDEHGARPAAAEIFARCVAGVDDADAVVGVVDGADVDSGTAWELGYAYARGKPIASLRTDYRAAEHGPVNIMLDFGCDRLVRAAGPTTSLTEAIDELQTVVQQIVKESGRSSDRPAAAPHMPS